MAGEGYIKFSCEWRKVELSPSAEIDELTHWRMKLYDAGFIGQYENGVGFGNISLRLGHTDQFIISGSATGGIRELTPEHYAKVLSYDFSEISLICQGGVEPSSESLTHAAVYRSVPSVKAVVHVHCLEMWQRLYGKVPTTAKEVPHETLDMAREVERLFQESDVRERRMLVMGGHEEGLISFGRDLASACLLFDIAG